MNQDQADPVIDEVRRVRQSISARFDHDPKQLVDDYIELQGRHRKRLIDRPKPGEPTDQSAA